MPRPRELVFEAGRQFSIYVHFPLCAHRCAYCDFGVVTAPQFPNARYCDAVLRELEFRAPDYQARELIAIHFGGGTPSLWPARYIERVVATTERLFSKAADCEVTVEANPGDLTRDKLAALRAAGVNRLSIGVQSLDDHVLDRLTRKHDARTARQALRLARDAGFRSLNADLIFGIAGISIASQLAQVDALIELAPDHIALYQLTLAPGSPLRRAGVSPASDDESAGLLERARDRLSEDGFVQYEVSNYARTGAESRYNSSVWAGLPYLGVGASAHSLHWSGHENARVANYNFLRYLESVPHRTARPRRVSASHVDHATAEQAQLEWLAGALRTRRGVDRASFRERFGVDPQRRFGGSFARFEAAGLVSCGAAAIYPTARGLLFADELALRLEPDDCGEQETEPSSTVMTL